MSDSVDAPLTDFSSEITIGLVAPVGANLTSVLDAIQSRLSSRFGFSSRVIKISELIGQLGLDCELIDDDPAARYQTYMDGGNLAREVFSRGDSMALCAINEILSTRADENGQPVPQEKTAHILQSLKHPDEVRTLRTVYGPVFFL